MRDAKGPGVLAVSGLLVLGLALPRGGGADLFIRYLPHPLPPQGEVYDNLDVYLSGGKVLMTGQSRSGTTYSAWYDSADATFRIYDPGRRGYYALNRETFSASRVQHRRFRRDMASKLRSTPETKKSAMQQALEQFESEVYEGPPPERFEYTEHGGGGSEAGIDCIEHEVLHLGKLVRLLCLSDFGLIGASSDDIATLQGMQSIAAEIAYSARRAFQLMPVYVLDLESGFPVRIRYLDSGEELRLNRLTTKIPKEPTLDSYRQQRKLTLETVH
jgi:hypothetical protein